MNDPFASTREAMRRLELAEAAHNARFAEAVARTRPATRAEARALGGGWVCYSGPKSMLNQALGMGLEGPVPPEQLDEIEALLGRDGGPVMVSLLPSADGSLALLLASRGYRVAEFNQVLSRSLSAEPFAATPAVRQVRPGEEVLFSRTVLAGFLERDEVTAAESDWSLPIGSARDTVCFFAMDGERAVGAGSMCLWNGVAVLSGTSVLPAARGRGFHAQLIRARLAHGKKAGCTLATSSTLPGSGSQRNLERAGFRVSHCKVMMSKP